jgi:hypothetical protein
MVLSSLSLTATAPAAIPKGDYPFGPMGAVGFPRRWPIAKRPLDQTSTISSSLLLLPSVVDIFVLVGRLLIRKGFINGEKQWKMPWKKIIFFIYKFS